MITLRQLVDYIEKNRTGKVFCGWTRDEITESMLQGIHDNSMLYAVDGLGSVVGVVCGTRFIKERVLHVDNVLVTGGRDIFISFMKRFKVLFPGWKLEAQRRRKLKHYDTERFVNKVTKGVV